MHPRPFDPRSTLRPTLPANSPIGEGDSHLVHSVLPESLEADAFHDLKNEVQWRTMYHHGGEVPRLVAVQGQVLEDGSFPVYRHPSDESPPLHPFSPTVAAIRTQVESVLGHQVNHVLIQLYRAGSDYISEHSDKTIDVVRGSNIVNVSLGAERIMVLRTKRDAVAAAPQDDDGNVTVHKREVQRLALKHNSMFVMGPATNMKWLHGIRQDKRMPTLKTADELAYEGERISLTFRYIGTYLTQDAQHIFGQGATGKTREEMRPVIAGDEEASAQMILAFSREIRESDFDWDAVYGSGSDVLHFDVKQANT